MCGIVGVVGREDAAPRLLDALKRLEYRGYDSAGIATLVDGAVERRRAEVALQQQRREQKQTDERAALRAGRGARSPQDQEY